MKCVTFDYTLQYILTKNELSIFTFTIYISYVQLMIATPKAQGGVNL